MRRVTALGVAVIALAALLLAAPSANGADAKFQIQTRTSAPPPARTPSVLRGGNPGIDRFDGVRPGPPRRFRGQDGSVIIVPQVVFVTPSNCWQPGYWAYQWVPPAVASTMWVPGQWSPDGYWIDGYYAPMAYSSGYYQPAWVEGFWSSCQ
jgi:hypothetical protein